MLTEAQKQICVEKAEFVLLEIQRIGELLNRGSRLQDILGEGPSAMLEFFAKLKHAETKREYTCGQKAFQIFPELALIALAGRPDVQDFDPQEVSERLRATLLSFVFNNRDVSVADFIEEWLRDALVSVSRRHRSYTHYIPCVALQIGDGDSYRLGAIEFSRKSRVRAEALDALTKYESARDRLSNRARRNAAPGLQWCWDRATEHPPKDPAEAFDRLTEGVEWIAKITVPRCACRVSKLRAEAALRLALCGTTLILPNDEGAALRLKDDPSNPFQVNKLSSIGTGTKFRPSSSWRFGTPKVGEGWREHIESKASQVLTVLEHLIEQALAGQPLSFGFQIALRAITWYADAVRETNVETRLVKCTTAIECLLLPPKRQATAAFVIRGALLAQRDAFPMGHWAPIAKRLYERRGDVVHGNIDSLRSAVQESSSEAMDFTRNVVLQFLVFCHRLQPLGPRRVGTRDDFLSLYREAEGRFHDDVDAIVKKYKFAWNVMPSPAP